MTSRRHETEHERVDRNFEELLAGLRVALPGVQVLFAFLLILPFQAGFPSLSAFGEVVYLVTLIATALASVCFIAAPVHHRILFRSDMKERIATNAHRLSLVGYCFLGIAIVGALVLVTHPLFDTAVVVVTATVIAVTLIATWFAWPLAHRRRRGPRSS